MSSTFSARSTSRLVSCESNPAGPHDLLLGPRSGEQLIDQLVRQLLAHPVRQPLTDPKRGRRRLATRLDAGGLTIRTSTYI